MPKKSRQEKDYPMAVQQRYQSEMDELGATNALPRDDEFDLKKTSSRTRYGSWGDEQTYTVVKPGGNCPSNTPKDKR